MENLIPLRKRNLCTLRIFVMKSFFVALVVVVLAVVSLGCNLKPGTRRYISQDEESVTFSYEMDYSSNDERYRLIEGTLALAAKEIAEWQENHPGCICKNRKEVRWGGFYSITFQLEKANNDESVLKTTAEHPNAGNATSL